MNLYTMPVAELLDKAADKLAARASATGHQEWDLGPTDPTAFPPRNDSVWMERGACVAQDLDEASAMWIATTGVQVAPLFEVWLRLEAVKARKFPDGELDSSPRAPQRCAILFARHILELEP